MMQARFPVYYGDQLRIVGGSHCLIVDKVGFGYGFQKCFLLPVVVDCDEASGKTPPRWFPR